MNRKLDKSKRYSQRFGAWFKAWWPVCTATFAVLCAVVTGTWYLFGKARDLTDIESSIKHQNNSLDSLRADVSELKVSLQPLTGLKPCVDSMSSRLAGLEDIRIHTESNHKDIESLHEIVGKHMERLSNAEGKLDVVWDLVKALTTNRELKYGSITVPGQKTQYYDSLPDFLDGYRNALEKYDSLIESKGTDTAGILRVEWQRAIVNDDGSFTCIGPGKDCYSVQLGTDPDDMSMHFEIEAHFASIGE